MIIDAYSHIVPKKYKDALLAKSNYDLSKLVSWVTANRALTEIDVRLRLMDRYPDVMQVLVPVLAPLEVVASQKDAIELATINNDETAELVAKYPDKFIAGVALLPLNDVDASVKEADRAITQLGLRGVLVQSNINGEPLDAPKFRPLYKVMAHHDLPIWIHPWYLPVTHGSAVNELPKSIREYFAPDVMLPCQWPIDTTLAMIRLALSGVFKEYPNIKFITHHCGGIAPYCEGRIKLEDTHKFYGDTAVRGTLGALMCGFEFFGADHMLFGTDAPQGASGLGEQRSNTYGVTQETIDLVEKLQISETDKKKIFVGNALRILKLAI